jgi:hypothetical protein
MHRVSDHVMPLRSCSCAFARQPLGCKAAWSRPAASTVRSATSTSPASARFPHRPRLQTASPSGGAFMKRWPSLRTGSTPRTQGKIISAVHSRIPIVTPNEQRALRVRQRPQRPDKASRHEGAKGGFTRVTCSTGHAGVSANSQLTLRVDHSMKPVSVAEGTAIGAACHSL